jgi:hypothetical protein
MLAPDVLPRLMWCVSECVTTAVKCSFNKDAFIYLAHVIDDSCDR